MVLTVCLVAVAYLVGSVSTAIVVCRLLGVADPREVGSQNPGASNVLRHAGKTAAGMTLLGDAGKGLIPVLLANAAGVTPSALALVALAAFVGHLYPAYYRFQGGKGVATFIGVSLGLNPLLGLTFIGVWLLLALLLRYSSLAALAAALTMPVAASLLAMPQLVVAAYCVMVALMYWRHRSNIRNLIAGREKKIGQRA